MKKILKIFVVIFIMLLVVSTVYLLLKLNTIKDEVKILSKNNVIGEYIEYDLGYRDHSVILRVPKDVVYVETCCMYVSTFASFKDVETLEKEANDILDEYYEKNNEGYYLEEYNISNITISVDEGEIVNYIHYTYS